MIKPDFRKPIPNIESVVEEWKDSLTRDDWDLISVHQTLSEPFIEKWKYKVHWHYISCYQKLSEPFIEKWKDEVAWPFTSYYQTLSEPFIEKWKDKVNWVYISINQKLSESFIEKFQDKVDWYEIFHYQALSEPFIEKFQDKIIDWFYLERNKNIRWNDFSEDFFEKYYQHFDLEKMNKKRPFSNDFCLKHNLDSRWNK